MSQYFLDNLTFGNDTFDLHDTGARQLIDANTQNISSLSLRVTQNANDIDALEETTADLREDLDSVEDRVTANEGEIDALKTRTTSLEGRMNSAETRLDGHDTDIASLQNRMSAAEDDIDLLETRMFDAETDIDALEDRMDAVEQKNTEQDAAIEDLDDRVTQNTADIVDIKDDIDDIKDDIEDLDDRITASTYEAGIGIYFGQGEHHTNINVEDELLDQINQNTLDIEILKNSAKLPAGGAAGQVLKKRSATDYDTQWADDLHTDYVNITGARSSFTAPNTQRNFSLSLDNVQDAGHFWNDIQYLVPFQCNKAVVDVRPTTGAHTTITEGSVKTTLKTLSSPMEVGSIGVEEILIGNIGNISVGDGVSDPHALTFTLGLSASEKALLNTLLTYISSFDGKTTIGVPVLANNAYVVDIEFDFVISSGTLRVRGIIPKAFLDPNVTGDYYDAAVFSFDYDIANDTPVFSYQYLDTSGGGGSTTLAGLTDVALSSVSNGQVLTYNATSQKWVNATAPTGVDNLVDLTDTAITSPSNGQVLKYNSTTQKWENANESGGGGVDELVDLLDTNISNPTNGQALIYDSASAKWVNGAAGGGGSVTYAGYDDNTISNFVAPGSGENAKFAFIRIAAANWTNAARNFIPFETDSVVLASSSKQYIWECEVINYGATVIKKAKLLISNSDTSLYETAGEFVKIGNETWYCVGDYKVPMTAVTTTKSGSTTIMAQPNTDPTLITLLLAREAGTVKADNIRGVAVNTLSISGVTYKEVVDSDIITNISNGDINFIVKTCVTDGDNSYIVTWKATYTNGNYTNFTFNYFKIASAV